MQVTKSCLSSLILRYVKACPRAWLRYSHGSQYALCMHTQTARPRRHAGRVQNARREYMLNQSGLEIRVIAMAPSFKQEAVFGGR